MKRTRAAAPVQHDNLFTGLLWQTDGSWKGCFCIDATPNAKPNCSLTGPSVRNLVVTHDNGTEVGMITIQPIENSATDLAGTGVFRPVEGAAVGLAVFYDHLRGRYQLKRQRQRPALV